MADYTRSACYSRQTNGQGASGSASQSRADAPGSRSAQANNAPADTAQAQTSTYQQPSKYQFVKEHWGSRSNFHYSHGLRMVPNEDFEEADLILAGYMELDRQKHGASPEKFVVIGRDGKPM
ncbi:hypothetical protein DHEL01_v209923 [Diaporthe helianthi]|uniref:Uncharacterized protein n=1 Tax=Diaporthe helianthi TaxID=158607 RepID=A0A2P5HN58_DIAHE|nr:hypothetical protein DHEL01_v209923 [Diaporthe helianthi]